MSSQPSRIGQINPSPNLDQAEEYADLDRSLPEGIRFRWLKGTFMRVARQLTGRQTAFNGAILQAVRELSSRIDVVGADVSALSDLSDGDSFADRQGAVAAVRHDLVEIQQHLTELRQISGATSKGREPGCHREERDGAPPGLATSEASGESGESVPQEVCGVNIFGDWAATTGLAQAARRLTVAIAESGFELTVGTVRSGAPTDEARVPRVIREAPRDRRHRIDLWMLNVNELRQVPDTLLRTPGRRSYAVGVWYWELPTLPDSLVAQTARVDEIWVASRFVQSAFRSVARCPVHIVPAVIPELSGSGHTRADFGLAEDEVVFLFSFDVHSMVARKNPGGFLKAFELAFHLRADTKARLVIKVLNLDRHPAVDRWLRPAVSAVNGVLIQEDLEHGELVDLISCCDAYVSLHRSEGFGFGIAEAMALGKPVIATAYSGNVDFATSANSFQVGYSLSRITSADHAFGEGAADVYRPGAVWAEPDVGQAARWMQLIYADPDLRQRVGEAGRAMIRECYSAEAAVAVVTERLREIRARIAATG